MYQIIIDGAVVAVVILPCYVYYDEVIQSFCTCGYAEAEAVLVNTGEGEDAQSFYADLTEKEIRHEGFPVATIKKIDKEA